MSDEKKQKVIAVTEIHRTIKPGVRADKVKGTPSIPPEVQVIKAKTVFMSGGEELEYLLGAGAVRKPEKDEKVAVDISHVVADGEDEKPKAKKTAGKAKAVSDMTGAELDAYLEASELTAPEDWGTMKVADKKTWLADAEATNDLV